YGSGGRAVALPRFHTMDAVVGREQQRPVDVGQVGRDRAGGAGVDVLDEGGADGGAGALPRLWAVRALRGRGKTQRVHVVRGAWGLMSLPRSVPAAVPSLFHSSTPFTPSAAEKNRAPLTFVRLPGFELALPGMMSLPITVPAVVPLLFHSSEPCVPSLAAKNRVPLTFVSLSGFK